MFRGPQGLPSQPFPALRSPKTLLHPDWGAAALFTVWEVYPTDASQPRPLEGNGDRLWESQARGIKPSFGRSDIGDFLLFRAAGRI